MVGADIVIFGVAMLVWALFGNASNALVLVGVAALAVFFLFVASVIGFVMFGASVSVLGSGGLFLVQFALGLLMASAGLRWLPRIKRMASRQSAYSVVPPVAIQRSVASSRRRRRGHRHGTAMALRSRAP